MIALQYKNQKKDSNDTLNFPNGKILSLIFFKKMRQVAVGPLQYFPQEFDFV